MIDFIKKTVHPPGITKPNRLSLFQAVGDIAEKVRADAVKAFNAHFPYLADSAKLEEHGNALIIPHLLEDTEKGYRDRVSTASFFLMKAGERAYITSQLNAHFGDRCVVSDEFLNIYVKVLEIGDTDRSWLHGFLDSLLNPNIRLTVADWFRFVEQILITESHAVNVKKKFDDIFPLRGFRYDGRFLCDQGIEFLCDGEWLCDGSADCVRFMNAPGTVTGIVHQSLFCNGAFICDGRIDCSGYEYLAADDTLAFLIVPSDMCEDVFYYKTFAENMAESVTATDGLSVSVIRLLRCDGSRTPSCSLCDGSIVCDGSYTGFDGRYYREDIFQEVI
ncbi:MAG: hypothetical protein LBH35_08380 [Treponema sp.]|jgi:hypothetical protein|nr:hypothetical protein [Treponema sp.]